MSLARFALDEATGSLWRNRRSNVLSILTIAVALFVFGVFAVAWVNVRQLVATLQNAAEVSVFLADSVTPEERAAIEALLASSPAVQHHRFVSRDEALRRFANAFPELAGAAAAGTDHPLPASFDVRLRPGAGRDPAVLQALGDRLRQAPGVIDVQYDQHWLERLEALVRGVRALGLALSFVLALGAALTVTSAVRLALQARTQEIEIMQLVGAPLAAIRGPFVIEGVLQGALGAAVALVALYSLQGLVRGPLDAAGALVPGGATELRYLPWTWAIGLLIGGVIVGCIGGAIASRGAR